MRVELPWPDPKLAPNRRNGKHWTVTHTAKLSAFGDAATLTMQALRATGYQAPADGPIGLTLTFCPPDRRRRDLDNMLKPMLDALTYVKVWSDDSQIDDLRIIRAPVVAGGRVTVRVEQIGGR